MLITRPPRTPSRPRRQQTGVMLLEALIAILIFSLGILAIIGLQAQSIRNSSEAKYRADASFLANQLIGYMWTDPANFAAYSHMPTGAVCEPIACSCEGARHCVAGCETTGCGLAQVCDPTSHRCVEQPCTAARTECPPNFVCTWPEGGCMRLDCTSDGNCPSGYCALGFCQEALGTCFLPPP